MNAIDKDQFFHEVTQKSLVTIRRPSGAVETVTAPFGECRGKNAGAYQKIVESTRKSGRGEVVSVQDLPPKKVPMTDAEIAEELRLRVKTASLAWSAARYGLMGNRNKTITPREIAAKAALDAAKAAVEAFENENPELLAAEAREKKQETARAERAAWSR